MLVSGLSPICSRLTAHLGWDVELRWGGLREHWDSAPALRDRWLLLGLFLTS